MKTKRTGYLILDQYGYMLGPNVGIAYKTRIGAQRALETFRNRDSWPWSETEGKVVYVRINIIGERT